MTQDQWDARVAARNTDCGGCLWQYFKFDDASGMPQDSSGNDADMDSIGETVSYQQAGPFSGASSLRVVTVGSPSGGVVSSVQNPPTNTANYAHPKTLEAWVNITDQNGVDAITLIAAGNIGIVMDLDETLKIARWANPNTFSANTSTSLQIGTWYFIMLTTVTNSGGDLDFNLYINETLEVTTVGDAMPWPIPNGSLARLGALPAFNEVGGQRGYFSNMALYDVGGLTPDFPHTPQLVSMNAVIPTAGP